MGIELKTEVRQSAAPGLRERGIKLHAAILRGVDTATIGLQAEIISNKLHGQVLFQRSGNLVRNVITLPAEDRGNTVIGVVGVSSTAWYGKIHEFGGTFVGHRTLKNPPHLVTRRGGERVMTGSPFGIHFPERSFLCSTLTEATDEGRIRAWIEGPIREIL